MPIRSEPALVADRSRVSYGRVQALAKRPLEPRCINITLCGPLCTAAFACTTPLAARCSSPSFMGARCDIDAPAAQQIRMDMSAIATAANEMPGYRQTVTRHVFNSTTRLCRR